MAYQRRCYVTKTCKWCKEWKKAEQLISVAEQTEISISKTEELAEEEADSTQVERTDTEPSSATGEHCLPKGLPSPGATRSS